MKFKSLPLQGAYVIEPNSYEDHRGKFSRIFCQEEFKKISHYKPIVQINHSTTTKVGTVRGMHYQKSPKAEIKIVKCIKGVILDVIIDIRENSPTFLKWYGEILSSENMKTMYVPEGFAHGFQSLEDNAEIIYFVTEFFSPENEGGIRYDDPLIQVLWQQNITDISDKDRNIPLLSQGFKGI